MKKIIIILSISLFLVCSMLTAAESGSLDPVPFPKVGNAGPAANSKFFVVSGLIHNGTAEISLPIDTPERSMAVVLGEFSASAFVGDETLEPIYFSDKELTRISMPEGNTRFNLDQLQAGRQLLTLNGLKSEKYVQMVVSQPASPLELEVTVKPLAAHSGDKVTVFARLKDEKFPVEAVITGDTDAGISFGLNDDGTGADETADDGIFTGTFTAPEVDGFNGVNIRFTAEGKRFQGTEFRRNVLSAVMVTNPVGKVLGNGISAGPAGIVVPLKAAEGKFRVEIIFGYNGTTLAYSSEEVVQTGNASNVTLPMPEAGLSADRAVVRLLNMKTLGLEDELEIRLTPTQAPPDFDALARKTVEMPYSKALAAEKMKEENQSAAAHKHDH